MLINQIKYKNENIFRRKELVNGLITMMVCPQQLIIHNKSCPNLILKYLLISFFLYQTYILNNILN